MDNLLVGVGGAEFSQRFQRLVSQQSYKLRLFKRADEAFVFALRYQPKLVFADYRLPDIDGISFLYRVKRELPNSVRILCVTNDQAYTTALTATGDYYHINLVTDTLVLSDLIDNALLFTKKQHIPVLAAESGITKELHPEYCARQLSQS